MAKAGKKGQAKQVNTRKKGKQSPKRAPGTSAAGAAAAAPPLMKKRKTDRADMDKAQRVIDRKLKHVPKDVRYNVVDASGRNIQDIVVEHIRDDSGMPMYVSSTVWDKIIKDFPIDSFPASQIEDPGEGDDVEVDDALLEAMGLCRSANPSVRSCDEFVQYFEHAGGLSKQTVWGVLQACAPGPQLTVEKSQVMLMAVLDYWARAGLTMECREWWAIMEEPFDAALCTTWQECLDTGTDRACFSAAKKDSLLEFIPHAVLERIIEADENEKELEIEDVHAALVCEIGRQLFAKEAKEMSHKLFLRTIEKRLEDAVHDDFSKTSVDAFFEAAGREVSKMTQGGKKVYQKTKQTFSFCNKKIQLQVCSFMDHVTWRYECRKQELALSAGLLQRTPWETLLWGDRGIPGISEHVKIPDEQLSKDRNARKSVAKTIGGVKSLTIEQMQDAMKTAKPGLLHLGKARAVPAALLEQCVPEMLADVVRQSVLDELPDGGAGKKSPAQDRVVAAIMRLRSGALVSAAGTTLSREVQGILALINSVLENNPPTAQKVAAGNDFYKQALQRLLNWATWDVSEKKGHFISTETVVGTLAVREAYKVFQAGDLTEDNTKCMEILRRYSWVLSEAERRRVDDAGKDFVKALKQKAALQQKSLQDGDPASTADGSKSAGSKPAAKAASSSSAAKCAVQQEKTDISPAEKKAAASKANMLTFFIGKKKTQI